MSAGAAQCPCPYCLAEINGIYLTVHFTAPPVLHSLKLDSLHEKKYSEQEVSLRRPLSLRTQIPIGGSMHNDWRWPVGVRAHPSADLVSRRMDAIRVRSDQPRRADLASLVSLFPSREASSVGNVRAESLSLCCTDFFVARCGWRRAWL